jgi:hypothetical protein
MQLRMHSFLLNLLHRMNASILRFALRKALCLR